MNRTIIQETARFTRAAHRHPAVIHLLLSSSHEISTAWSKPGRGKDSHWHQLGVDPPARIGRYWYQRYETRDSVADLDLIMRWRVKQGAGEQSWLPPASSHDLQRQQAQGMISRGHVCISSIDAAAAVARDDARVQVLDCEVDYRRISLSGRFAAIELYPFGDDRAILYLWYCGLQTKQAGLLWSAGNAHRACFANGGALAPNATAAGKYHAAAKQSVAVWSELFHDIGDGQLRARSVRWRQAAQDEDGGSTCSGSGALVVPTTRQDSPSHSPTGRLLFADCLSSKDEGSLFVSLSDRTTIESWVAVGSRFSCASMQQQGQEQQQQGNSAPRMLRLLARSIGGYVFPESTDSHVYALTDVPARGSASWNRARDTVDVPADASRSSACDASMDAEVAHKALREERAVRGGAAPLRIVRASFSQIIGSGSVRTVGCPAPIGCDDDLDYAPGTVDSMLPLWDWEELQVACTHKYAAADWQTVDYDLFSQPAADTSTLTTLKQAGADRHQLLCKARPPVMVQYQLCGETGRPRVIASALPPHGTEADSDYLQVRQLQAVELPSVDDAVGIEARSNDDPSSPVVRYIIKRGAGYQMPVDVVLYCNSSGVLRSCSLPMSRSSTIFEKTIATANNASSAKPASLLGRLASAVYSALLSSDQDDVERKASRQPPRLDRASSTVATVHSHKSSTCLDPIELEVISADAIRGHTKRSPKSFQTEWVTRYDLQQARDTMPPTQLKLQTRYEYPLELASRRLSVPVRYGAENLDFGVYESLLKRKGTLAPESVPITVTGHPDAVSCFEDTLRRGSAAPESECGAGKFPVAVSVYGCYGVSMDNSFDAGMLPFYLRGGVMVYAHVRGGGERGYAWHAAGRGPVGKALAAHDLSAVLRIASAACGGNSVGLVAESAGGVLAGWALACKVSGVHSHAWLPRPAALPSIGAAFLSCPFVDLGGAAAAHRGAASRDNAHNMSAAGSAGYAGIAGDALFAQELSEWGDPAAPGGQGDEAFELLRGLCPTATAKQGRVNKEATADATSQPRVVLTTGELDLRVPADTVMRFGEALRGVGCDVALIGNSGPGSGHLNDNGAIEIADGASEVQEKAVRSAFLSAVLSPGGGEVEWPRSGLSD